jgi:hypothetical protein
MIRTQLRKRDNVWNTVYLLRRHKDQEICYAMGDKPTAIYGQPHVRLTPSRAPTHGEAKLGSLTPKASSVANISDTNTTENLTIRVC